MKIDDLTIAQVAAIAAACAPGTSAAQNGAAKQIVVVDRGFVYIGDVSLEGDFAVIRNAKNIRVWGTTKGLGELVSGPTSKTILDPVGTVRVPMRAVISLIDVDANKWSA